MKNLVLLLVIVFAATTLIGCGKKKTDETASMEGLNGVVSENVISVTDQSTEAIPVIVDNAQNMITQTEEVAAGVVDEAAAALKPTAKQIQQALKNAGIYAGKVDGEIGPRTKKAIEAFQSQNGLKADGKVGAKTWKALSGYLNKTTEVVNPTDAVQSVGQ